MMNQTPEPTIRVRVDPTNPGQFFACCGLLELADRLWGEAEGWFEDDVFCVVSGGTLRELLDALVRDLPIELTRLANGLGVKPLIAPLRLLLPSDRGNLTLDAWTRIRLDRGEVVVAANPPWNFWSGQQTSLRIWAALRAALQQQMTALDASRSEALFAQRVPLSGRFGFDPGAAWNALDAGFSPNEQKIEVASSPVVELLAAVGIQRFRPTLADDRTTFIYAEWDQPLPLCIAAAAACGLLTSSFVRRFRGRVVNRGSYAALGFSTRLQGANDE